VNKKRLFFVAMMCAVLCLSSIPVSADCNGVHITKPVCGGQIGSTTGLTHYYSAGSHNYGQITHRTNLDCTGAGCDFYVIAAGQHTVINGHFSFYSCGSSDTGCPY